MHFVVLFYAIVYWFCYPDTYSVEGHIEMSTAAALE